MYSECVLPRSFQHSLFSNTGFSQVDGGKLSDDAYYVYAAGVWNTQNFNLLFIDQKKSKSYIFSS